MESLDIGRRNRTPGGKGVAVAVNRVPVTSWVISIRSHLLLSCMCMLATALSDTESCLTSVLAASSQTPADIIPSRLATVRLFPALYFLCSCPLISQSFQRQQSHWLGMSSWPSPPAILEFEHRTCKANSNFLGFPFLPAPRLSSMCPLPTGILVRNNKDLS